MAAWVYAIVTTPISVADVEDAIKQVYGADDVTSHDGISALPLKVLTFAQHDGRRRSLNVFLDGNCKQDYAHIYQGEATFLTLGKTGDGLDIMTAVLQRHGGYLVRDDEKEDFEFIHPVLALTHEELVEARLSRAAILGCNTVCDSLDKEGLMYDRKAMEEAFKSALRETVAPANVEEISVPTP